MAAALAAWFFKRRYQSEAVERSPESKVSIPARTGDLGVPSFSPPVGLFPGQWYENVDAAKLTAYMSRTKRAAVEVFFASLGQDQGDGEDSGDGPGTGPGGGANGGTGVGPGGGSGVGLGSVGALAGLGGKDSQKPPGREKVSQATERMASALSRYLTAPELFAIINGGQSPKQIELSLLGAHLNRLLPPISPPRPEVSPGEIRPLAVALLTVLGAMAGSFLAMTIFFASNNLEAWQTVGAVVGAMAGGVLAVFLAQNPRARRWLLAGVAGLAFFDALAAIFSGALLPFLPSLGRGSRLKRFLFYAGAILVLLLVNSEKAFDLKRYREAVTIRVGDYLSGAIPLLAVLTFRIKEAVAAQSESKKYDRDEGLLAELAFLAGRVRAKPGLKDDPSFSQLIRKLENAGFVAETPEVPEKGPRKLPWEAGLAELYEPFGIIEAGRLVVIEEEPVFKDGKVIRKGQAVPE
ncbi:MAG: hypothetical protein LBJ61_00715 [Deltaproteobacteria bacterium]|nr:hypothetical protein [Deltaproteobacteria bacterium]